MKYSLFLSRRIITIITLLLLASVSCYLLFLLQPQPFYRRSFDEIWNLGHIVFFFLITWFLLRYHFSQYCKNNLNKTLLWVALIATVSGFAIEAIQSQVGRNASLQDLIFDITGALLAFAFYIKKQSTNHFYKLIYLFMPPCLWPLSTSLLDEYNASQQFPVLSSFESTLEKTRFEADIPYQIHQGALTATFTASKYANLKWRYFPRDWRSFTHLSIDITNPEKNAFELICRIHDFQHESSWVYNDRFSQAFSIQSGSQQIRINLDDVKKAPKNRAMAMEQIASFACFTHRLSSPQPLVFKEIRLNK